MELLKSGLRVTSNIKRLSKLPRIKFGSHALPIWLNLTFWWLVLLTEWLLSMIYNKLIRTNLSLELKIWLVYHSVWSIIGGLLLNRMVKLRHFLLETTLVFVTCITFSQNTNGTHALTNLMWLQLVVFWTHLKIVESNLKKSINLSLFENRQLRVNQM